MLLQLGLVLAQLCQSRVTLRHHAHTELGQHELRWETLRSFAFFLLKTGSLSCSLLMGNLTPDTLRVWLSKDGRKLNFAQEHLWAVCTEFYPAIKCTN